MPPSSSPAPASAEPSAERDNASSPSAVDDAGTIPAPITAALAVAAAVTVVTTLLPAIKSRAEGGSSQSGLKSPADTALSFFAFADAPARGAVAGVAHMGLNEVITAARQHDVAGVCQLSGRTHNLLLRFLDIGQAHRPLCLHIIDEHGAGTR